MKNLALMALICLANPALAQKNIIVDRSIVFGVISMPRNEYLASDANYHLYRTSKDGESCITATTQDYFNPENAYLDEGQSYVQTSDENSIIYYGHNGIFNVSEDFGKSILEIKANDYPSCFKNIQEKGGEWSRISFPTKDIGFIAYENAAKVFATTDGGRNWKQCLDATTLNSTEYQIIIRDIDFINSNNGIIFGEYVDKNNIDEVHGSFIACTTDGGFRWTLSKVPEWLTTSHLLNQRAYVCSGVDEIFMCFYGDNRLLHSQDEGHSWTVLRTINTDFWKAPANNVSCLSIDSITLAPFRLLYFRPLNRVSDSPQKIEKRVANQAVKSQTQKQPVNTFEHHLYKNINYGFSIDIPDYYTVRFHDAPSYVTDVSTFLLSARDSSMFMAKPHVFPMSVKNEIVVTCTLNSRYPRIPTLDKLFLAPSYVLTGFTQRGNITVHPKDMNKKFVTVNGNRAIEITYKEDHLPSLDYQGSIRKTTEIILIKGGYVYAVRYTGSYAISSIREGQVSADNPLFPVREQQGISCIKMFKL